MFCQRQVVQYLLKTYLMRLASNTQLLFYCSRLGQCFFLGSSTSDATLAMRTSRKAKVKTCSPKNRWRCTPGCSGEPTEDFVWRTDFGLRFLVVALKG